MRAHRAAIRAWLSRNRNVRPRKKKQYAAVILVLIFLLIPAAQAQEPIFSDVTIIENDKTIWVDCKIHRELVRVEYAINGIYEGGWAVDNGSHRFIVPKVDTTEGIHRVYMAFWDMNTAEYDDLEFDYYIPPKITVDPIFDPYPPFYEEEPLPFESDEELIFGLMMMMIVGMVTVMILFQSRPKTHIKPSCLDAIETDDDISSESIMSFSENEGWGVDTPPISEFDFIQVPPAAPAEFLQEDTKPPRLMWIECPYCSEWNPPDRGRCNFCGGRLQQPYYMFEL